MPRPGVGVFGRSTAPQLEIKPDSKFVVFYGEPSEAQDAELKGKLVLTNAESMTVRSIRVTLACIRKVSWYTTHTVTPQPILSKSNPVRENIVLFPVDGNKNKPHKINAGVHVWDFKFKMPATLDESVEGVHTNWIVYDLHATVDRGYMSKPLSATQHIRVIRTLGRDLLETIPMEQINEDIWASKLCYKITVPQKNFIVGTSIPVDFVLIPIRKGVQIGTIKMELIESRHLFCEYAGRRISHQTDIQVAEQVCEMPEGNEHRVPEGVEEADQLFDESHRFKLTLELPKSLKKCRQSVDTDMIRITHKLKIYVNLKNPEGHTSQLLVKNHVHLFISPNLPPREDQSVVVDQEALAQQAAQDHVTQNAPPTYGLHQLDELYNDIDPSGFMTPGGRASLANSGANTPFYGGHSRSGSVEDLASLDAVTNGPSSAALHNRLQNLDLNQNGNSRFAPPRHHSSGGSTPHSMPDHAPPATYFNEGGDFDMEALARTPSYNTAVRTPTRTPISEDLPTYEIATSRPSSPSRSRGPTPSPTRSLDTLREETQRNTQTNSRRESLRMSNDGSPTHTLTPTSSNSTSSSTSSTSSNSEPSTPGTLSTHQHHCHGLNGSRPHLKDRTSSASSIRETLDLMAGFRKALRHVG